MVANILAGIAVVVSIIAIRVTLYLSSAQAKLQSSLSDKQGQLQADLTRETEALQERINKEETTADKRRFFLQLWDKWAVVNRINVAEPVATVVRINLNVMELMALCWQADIVDKRMMVLAFAKEYCIQYEELQQVNNTIPFLNRNGRELIGDSPTITVLYNEFKAEITKQGVM